MKHLLTDIPGIGESTAALLSERGIDSVKVLRKAGSKKLCLVPGFGEKRVVAVLAAADDLKTADKMAKRAHRDAVEAAREAGKGAKKAAGKADNLKKKKKKK